MRTTHDTDQFEASKRLFVQFAVKGAHGCACSASEQAASQNTNVRLVCVAVLACMEGAGAEVLSARQPNFSIVSGTPGAAGLCKHTNSKLVWYTEQ
jgi:hypothetical protein